MVGRFQIRVQRRAILRLAVSFGFGCFLRWRANRFAAWLNSGLVGPPIRETLASRTLDRKNRTFPIVHAKSDAFVVPKNILLQTTVRPLPTTGWQEHERAVLASCAVPPHPVPLPQGERGRIRPAPRSCGRSRGRLCARWPRLPPGRQPIDRERTFRGTPAAPMDSGLRRNDAGAAPPGGVDRPAPTGRPLGSCTHESVRPIRSVSRPLSDELPTLPVRLRMSEKRQRRT